jgi:hypothetical protein
MWRPDAGFAPEIFGLEGDDVDFSRREIRVHRRSSGL